MNQAVTWTSRICKQTTYEHLHSVTDIPFSLTVHFTKTTQAKIFSLSLAPSWLPQLLLFRKIAPRSYLDKNYQQSIIGNEKCGEIEKLISYTLLKIKTTG